MATTVEPVEDTDAYAGLHAAAGEFADALDAQEPPDDDVSIEADLADDGAESPDELDGAAETTPAEVEPPAADDAAPAATEADPYANAQPFTYTVDGASKTYDGIKLFTAPDGTVQGAVIPPESIKDVQYRLQRGDYLETQNKSLYAQTQDLDRVVFTDPAGTEHKGLAAVDAQGVELARLTAASKIMASVLEDPEKLYQLAVATTNGDQSELSRLAREISIAAKEASWTARETRGQRTQQATQQATQAQERSQVTNQAITASVNQWAQQFPQLTKDDTAKAVAHFAKLGTSLVRPATPDEAKAAGVKPGELVIDHPIIYEWLQDRAEMRAQATAVKTTASAQATAATKAANENAQRLAAAARGKSSHSTAKPGATTKTRKAAPVEDDEGETWAQQRARLQRGEYLSSDDE